MRLCGAVCVYGLGRRKAHFGNVLQSLYGNTGENAVAGLEQISIGCFLRIFPYAAASCGDRFVFNVSFHHMDEHGFYGGWTHHRVVVRPSLLHGLRITVGGPNRNDVKEHLTEVIRESLAYELMEDQRNALHPNVTQTERSPNDFKA